jgi:CubicO group peptidase (beta-lactamase class C family)
MSTLTGLLLADLAARGQAALAGKATDYLPGAVAAKGRVGYSAPGEGTVATGQWAWLSTAWITRPGPRCG